MKLSWNFYKNKIATKKKRKSGKINKNYTKITHYSDTTTSYF